MGGAVKSVSKFVSNTTGIKGLGETIIDPFDLSGGKAEAAQQAALGHHRTATGQANQYLANAYGNQKEYLNPYVNAGKTALERLSGGNLVNAETLAQDPGYQFRLAEGMKGINSNAAAKGMLNSGATLKALQRYGQDYASSEYDKAYNREYKNLSNLAGMGQGAASGLATAAGTLGSNMADNAMGLGDANASATIVANNARQQNMNQLLSMGTSFFSDERLKENVKPLDREKLAEMRKHLKAYAFNYMNNNHGEGDWIGVMAQDLEKSEIGKTLVIDTPEGKTIDQRKVLSMFLATMAEA